MDERVADDRVHLDAGEPVGSEATAQLAQEMVETALDPADDEQEASRLVGERCAERELEVGRVLVDRVALDLPSGIDRRRGRRVEVADREVDLEPKREGASAPLSAATTRAPGGIADGAPGRG